MTARILALWMLIGAGAGAATALGDTAAAPPAYSAAALYNLGNSYARAGKPGLAILHYERARLLTPDDPDLAANLAHVRETSHLPPAPRGALRAQTLRVNPTLASWLGVIGVILIGAALLDAPRHRGRRRVSTLAGLALVGVTAANGLTLWPTVHAAVVLTAATPARVSPVPMGDSLFTLADGETVQVTAEHDDFLLIETAAGRAGWVSRANLARVVP
jgi:hypothetical protein